MATDEVPWILALDGVECRICGHSIKLQYAAEDIKGSGAWRGYAQELKLACQQPGPQPLVPAELCYSFFQGETRTMHAACWVIVEGLWKSKPEYTMAELDGFLDVSSDLAPFLLEMPYTVSPIELDPSLISDKSERITHRSSMTTRPSEDLLTTLETEGLVKPLLPDIKAHALSPDLDRRVREWLSGSGADEIESMADPTLEYWASVVRMLAYHPHFYNAPRAKAADDITRILRILHGGSPDCFPHLLNYDTVHANAKAILLHLLRIPVEEIQSEPDLNGRRPRLQLSKDFNLPPALDAPAKLQLELSTLRRQGGAAANPDRSNLCVGMKYLRDIRVGPADEDIPADPDGVVAVVPSFAGLCFIRDHIGVLAVLAKQGETWFSCWQQDVTARWEEGMPGTERTVVEWQAGRGQPSFLIVSDTYRDILLLDQDASKDPF